MPTQTRRSARLRKQQKKGDSESEEQSSTTADSGNSSGVEASNSSAPTQRRRSARLRQKQAMEADESSNSTDESTSTDESSSQSQSSSQSSSDRSRNTKKSASAKNTRASTQTRRKRHRSAMESTDAGMSSASEVTAPSTSSNSSSDPSVVLESDDHDVADPSPKRRKRLAALGSSSSSSSSGSSSSATKKSKNASNKARKDRRKSVPSSTTTTNRAKSSKVASRKRSGKQKKKTTSSTTTNSTKTKKKKKQSNRGRSTEESEDGDDTGQDTEQSGNRTDNDHNDDEGDSDDDHEQYDNDDEKEERNERPVRVKRRRSQPLSSSDTGRKSTISIMGHSHGSPRFASSLIISNDDRPPMQPEEFLVPWPPRVPRNMSFYNDVVIVDVPTIYDESESSLSDGVSVNVSGVSSSVSSSSVSESLDVSSHQNDNDERKQKMNEKDSSEMKRENDENDRSSSIQSRGTHIDLLTLVSLKVLELQNRQLLLHNPVNTTSAGDIHQSLFEMYVEKNITRTLEWLTPRTVMKALKRGLDLRMMRQRTDTVTTTVASTPRRTPLNSPSRKTRSPKNSTVETSEDGGSLVPNGDGKEESNNISSNNSSLIATTSTYTEIFYILKPRAERVIMVALFENRSLIDVLVDSLHLEGRWKGSNADYYAHFHDSNANYNGMSVIETNNQRSKLDIALSKTRRRGRRSNAEINDDILNRSLWIGRSIVIQWDGNREAYRAEITGVCGWDPRRRELVNRTRHSHQMAGKKWGDIQIRYTEGTSEIIDPSKHDWHWTDEPVKANANSHQTRLVSGRQRMASKVVSSCSSSASCSSSSSESNASKEDGHSTDHRINWLSEARSKPSSDELIRAFTMVGAGRAAERVQRMKHRAKELIDKKIAAAACASSSSVKFASVKPASVIASRMEESTPVPENDSIEMSDESAKDVTVNADDDQPEVIMIEDSSQSGNANDERKDDEDVEMTAPECDSQQHSKDTIADTLDEQRQMNNKPSMVVDANGMNEEDQKGDEQDSVDNNEQNQMDKEQTSVMQDSVASVEETVSSMVLDESIEPLPIDDDDNDDSKMDDTLDLEGTNDDSTVDVKMKGDSNTSNPDLTSLDVDPSSEIMLVNSSEDGNKHSENGNNITNLS